MTCTHICTCKLWRIYMNLKRLQMQNRKSCRTSINTAFDPRDYSVNRHNLEHAENEGFWQASETLNRECNSQSDLQEGWLRQDKRALNATLWGQWPSRLQADPGSGEGRRDEHTEGNRRGSGHELVDRKTRRLKWFLSETLKKVLIHIMNQNEERAHGWLNSNTGHGPVFLEMDQKINVFMEFFPLLFEGKKEEMTTAIRLYQHVVTLKVSQI